VNGGARFERGDWPWIATLLLVGSLLLAVFALNAYRFTGGRGGVPLDDAWIHFQFARNLARGFGLSFNPGQPTSGSTAPLWTIGLAAVYRFGGRFPIAGQLLSGVCYLATAVATYWLTAWLTGKRWAGWLAGAVVVANGRMVWAGLSALETCLFAALSLAAIGAHLGDRAAPRYRLRTAALFGLAALSRPEGYLLFGLAMADLLLQSPKSKSQIANRKFQSPNQGSRITHHALRITHYVLRFTHHASRILLPILIFTAIVSPYLVFSLRTSGHLLPNTYHAKAVVDFRPDRDFFSVAARYLILDNPLLLPFYVLGVGVLLRRVPLLSLWSVGLPVVYAFLHAVLYQHGRYLIPLIPCNAVISLAGLLEARRLALRRGWRWRGLLTPGRGGAALMVLLVVAGTGWRLPAMMSSYAWNVDNINRMHVAMGEWAKAHTPPGTVLALNDIGAIAYVSERPVVDLAGLVTPEVVPLLNAPDRGERLVELMAERDVGYVIMFPEWFPDLAGRSDVLEPVHEVTLERRTVTGGERMVVYEAHWQR
jgi:arabinofuranosyltransferase